MNVKTNPGLGAAFGLLLFVTGGGQAALAQPVLDGDPIHGKVLFQKHCAGCHLEAKAPSLSDAGLINSKSEQTWLQMLHRGKLHGVKQGLDLLDAWDLVGHLRTQVPYVGDLFPTADRYIVEAYTIDEHARGRLKKSLGREISDADGTARVFTLFNTGSGHALQLVPQDPRLLDQLERRMKVGYVVFLVLDDDRRKKSRLAVALEPKQLHIVSLLATDEQGQPLPDLNKLLSRFRDKGDRRMSGTKKARLAVGGGGQQVKVLERSVTDVYLRSLEIISRYEVEERERSWADDDIEPADLEPTGDDFNVK